MICVLFGLYRGFIQSVLSLGGSLLSIVGSFLLYPRLADVVASNTDITRMISTYTDSQSLLGDLDLSSQELGLLSSLYFYFFAGSQIVIGILLARFGVRPVMVGGSTFSMDLRPKRLTIKPATMETRPEAMIPN